MSWKRMKGMLKAVNKCPRCHGLYPDDDYDLEDDMCLYCLFPEISGKRPVPLNHEHGFPRNLTGERELLDHLDEIPEVMSVQAKKNRDKYVQNRKTYK